MFTETQSYSVVKIGNLQVHTSVEYWCTVEQYTLHNSNFSTCLTRGAAALQYFPSQVGWVRNAVKGKG